MSEVAQGGATPVREGLFREDPPALLGARCENCGALRFPALAVCARCQHEGASEVALPDQGRVFTYTIVHAPPPGYAGEVPYALGVVELGDGLRVAATLLAEDLAAVRISAPCRLELFDLAGEDGAALRTYGFRIGEE
ncbi:MAG: Zn-ribbon domain-containing OB-fold protein [Actinobacteria bacterium]|nr:Zn-ribbon domain-containing OB-fold protein [Actinomycetota bacterium]